MIAILWAHLKKTASVSSYCEPQDLSPPPSSNRQKTYEQTHWLLCLINFCLPAASTEAAREARAPPTLSSSRSTGPAGWPPLRAGSSSTPGAFNYCTRAASRPAASRSSRSTWTRRCSCCTSCASEAAAARTHYSICQALRTHPSNHCSHLQ